MASSKLCAGSPGGRGRLTVAFVHCQVHTEYSVSCGMVRLPALMDACVSEGHVAVALTDTMNTFGAVKFYQRAMKAGVKPLLGCQWVCCDGGQPFRLLVYCQSLEGFRQLSRLLTRAYREPWHPEVGPCIQGSWLTPESTSALIGVIAGVTSDVAKACLNKRPDDEVQALVERWQGVFGSRLYVGLHRIGHASESIVNPTLLALADALDLPLLALGAVHFLEAGDFEAHEARVCINQGALLGDPKRKRLFTEQQYFATADEMQRRFNDLPDALENTLELAKRCNCMLDLGQVYLPDFPVPENQTLASYFQELSQQGMVQRLTDDAVDAAEHARYQARLDHEIATIVQMGFPGYFLIVADFICWAKDNHIPVGPGRGSGAGSLVAYALGITDVDPLVHELLFERFLNPERVSMPDFDVDFCMDGRDRVIEYVAERYGRDRVSQIITFGSMAAKAVIRDVGRILQHPYGFVDKIAKLIPMDLGMTLTQAMAQEEDLQQRYDQDEDVRAIYDLALKLEGLTRNVGKHAGGVVVAPQPLDEFSPLYYEAPGQGAVTQFDKDDVERIGLVKFDFLGLRTLTIIDNAVKMARRYHDDLPEQMHLLPLDDEKTFELLRSGKTAAIFQLESRGMRDLILRLQPDCFDDVVALVALFRPGPLQSGMVDDYVDRKHGRSAVAYLHPLLEPILKPTYGVILYQEQVMQIAQVLAGYTLGEADLLRRAMGKKKPEEMAKQRSIFLEGSKRQGVEQALAERIFDLMEKFAGYGFNKSHSVAYALLSYQTAWLKTHHPAAFMAAVLSADMDNTDKVLGLVKACRESRLTLLAPDIQTSGYKFDINEAGEIIYGLGAIKGVGQGIVDALVETRQAQGPFKDLVQVCLGSGQQKLNRRVLECFIRSGALDRLGPSRGVLLASAENALGQADRERQRQQSGQYDLLALLQGSQPEFAYVEADDLGFEQKLEGEKATLGLYWSGHPVEQKREALQALGFAPLGQLSQGGKRQVRVAGLLVQARQMTNKQGKRFAFVQIEDETGSVDLGVFGPQYAQFKEVSAQSSLLLVEGECASDEYSGGVRVQVDTFLDWEALHASRAGCLVICVKNGCWNTEILERLSVLLGMAPKGSTPVRLLGAPDSLSASVTLELGDAWRLEVTDALLEALEAWSDVEVQVEYR